MLELKKYPKAEMSEMFGTRDMEGLKRKMRGYGIHFDVLGRGNSAVFDIKGLDDPLKIYCIVDLGLDGRTDFKKARNFYNYFLNDEEFMAMPDEVKEIRMRKQGQPVSRQTIATYTAKLKNKNMIDFNTKNFIYYFAYKGNQIITTREKYLDAWKEYWQKVEDEMYYYDAIIEMRAKYGGVARKQPIPEINGIYLEEIEYFNTLIQQSIEKEIDTSN